MPALVWKMVRPKTLKIPGVREALRNASRRQGTLIKKDFQATTKTWKHKVAWDVTETTAKGQIAIMVGTDDEIYRYVSGGTKRHRIEARNAKALAFSSGYSAKTKPGYIGSYAGGPYGPMMHAKAVMHPGTKARRFEETIAKKWLPRYRRAMELELKRAVRASGHGK